MNVKSKEIWKVYQRDTRKSFNLEKLRPTYVVVSWLETFLLLISKMHQSLQNWQKAWIRGQKTGVLFKNIEGAYKFDLESVLRITKYIRNDGKNIRKFKILLNLVFMSWLESYQNLLCWYPTQLVLTLLSKCQNQVGDF